jgi:hypothetical protein
LHGGSIAAHRQAALRNDEPGAISLLPMICRPPAIGASGRRLDSIEPRADPSRERTRVILLHVPPCNRLLTNPKPKELYRCGSSAPFGRPVLDSLIERRKVVCCITFAATRTIKGRTIGCGFGERVICAWLWFAAAQLRLRGKP